MTALRRICVGIYENHCMARRPRRAELKKHKKKAKRLRHTSSTTAVVPLLPEEKAENRIRSVFNKLKYFNAVSRMSRPTLLRNGNRSRLLLTFFYSDDIIIYGKFQFFYK